MTDFCLSKANAPDTRGDGQRPTDMRAPAGANPLNPLNLPPVSIKAPHVAGTVRPHSFSASAHVHKSMPRRSCLSDNALDRVLETRQARLPCFTLTQIPNPNFVGRRNLLAEIDKYLLPSDTETADMAHQMRLFALCGMGGIGKTDLAVEYAFTRRSRFAAILWLDAGSPAQLAADFGRIASHLGLESADEARDLQSSIQLAKAWMTRPRTSSSIRVHEDDNDWLLIFDNADNLEDIIDFVPQNGNGSVLVTSRDPFAKEQFFSNGSGIDLEPLSTAESATLLRKLIVPRESSANKDECDASLELAKQLDGLPLAMTQMAGFIRRRHLSMREFVSSYGNDARYAEIHGMSHPAQEHRYGYTLATTYNLQGLSSSTMDLVRILAFLSPDRIREDIFVSPTPHRRCREPAEGQPWSSATFEAARYESLASSIIKRDVHKKELRIHRVIQAEIRTALDEELRYKTFKSAVDLVSRLWPPGNLSIQANKRWVLCEDLLPHIERFRQFAIEYSDAWSAFEVDAILLHVLNEAGM